MNLGFAWPQISDKLSARKAIVGGFWAAIFIIGVDLLVATYALITREKFGGYYDAWILVDAALFGVIAWRLWKNSRSWAVLALLLTIAELWDKLRNARSTFGVITIALLLCFINATRGAFAFHKYSVEEDASKPESVPPTQ